LREKGQVSKSNRQNGGVPKLNTASPAQDQLAASNNSANQVDNEKAVSFLLKALDPNIGGDHLLMILECPA
jgi:hypothetical protein